MLRTIGVAELDALLTAAALSDLDLDLALLRIDVFAPADLDEIRALLQRPGVSLEATSNRDGHRIIEVHENGHRAALVHHDGRVQQLHPVAA
jgi:hypothetical protein